MFGNSFDYHNYGGWCYWHLVGGGQGCYLIYYNAQESSLQHGIIWPKMSGSSAKVEKHCFIGTTENFQIYMVL